MKEELKPCPFCREDDWLRLGMIPKVMIDEKHFVRCCVCGARGPERGDKEWAIRDWNDRTAE